jgi:transmembrane sensor
MRAIYSIRPEADASPDEAAATWFALLLSDDATDLDRRDLDAWRRASDDNALAWAKIATIWDYSAGAEDEPAIMALRREALARPAQRRSWIPAALAASLAITVVGTGVYTSGWVPGLLSGEAGPVQLAMETRDVRTAIGQRSNVSLSDGSSITVNTDSAIHVALSKSQRRVDLLNGEAYFRVAKDGARPFVVDASGLTVTAIGTRFSVRTLAEGATVALLDGHVRVERRLDGQLQSVLLDPGSVLRATSTSFTVTHADAKRVASWTTGRLSFDQTPLKIAVDELNRYSATKILLADPSLGSTPVTGLFATDRPEELVTMLAASGRVQSTKRPDGTTVLRSAR